MRSQSLKAPPETCPICGADIPRDAKSCPECGSDHETGWSDEAYANGLGLPDDNFDYDEFVQKELGKDKEIKPRGLHWFWWIVGICVAGAFLFFSLRVFFN